MSQPDADSQIAELFDMFGEDPWNTELLVPELRETVFTGSGGMVYTGHPLVHGLLSSWKIANYALMVKKRDVREAIREKEWHRLVWLYERPYRVEAVHWLMRREKMTRAELLELWIDVWQDTEFPSRCPIDPLVFFRHFGFVTDDPDGWRKQPERMHVFRGLAPWGEKRVDPRLIDPGCAWTADLEKARWFARRYASTGGGVVLCYTCAKEEPLGWIVGRNEEEVILDFELRSDPGAVRVLERMTQ